jgi:hypothetical protein
MRAIRTKITFFVFVLFLAVLAILLPILFFFLGLTALFTLLSLIPVWYVIDKIRDSLSEKLKYINKSILSNLYFIFNNDLLSLFHGQDETKKLTKDLKKYNKFLVFSLYPRESLIDIEKYLSLHVEFLSRWEKIEEKAKENIKISNETPYSPWDFAMFIGLNIQYQRNISKDLKQEYERIKKIILNDNPKIIPETVSYFEEIKLLKETIFNQLKDFLMSNNLERLQEPSPLLR